MTGPRTSPSLLRSQAAHTHARATYVELFFDLVFVFAVTQLSHALLAHFTVQGAIETGLLLMGLWWLWIYTTWITNWLDPNRAPVRLALFAIMLAGLLLSVSIPFAFTSRGLTFALAYAGGATLVLVLVAIWETVSLTPSPSSHPT